jgi:hypothetical protein
VLQCASCLLSVIDTQPGRQLKPSPQSQSNHTSLNKGPRNTGSDCANPSPNQVRSLTFYNTVGAPQLARCPFRREGPEVTLLKSAMAAGTSEEFPRGFLEHTNNCQIQLIQLSDFDSSRSSRYSSRFVTRFVTIRHTIHCRTGMNRIRMQVWGPL